MSNMKRGQYPIRAVSKQTGLSIDTLRAWERRYGTVVPERTDRGRVYNAADIERLLLLRKCTELGFAIGQIATWNNKQLTEALAQQEDHPETTEDTGTVLDRLIESLKTFDSTELDRELTRLAILYVPAQLVREIVLPFMNAVGNLWNSGRLSIAQEHLASASLRNVLGSLLRYYARSNGGPAIICATPSGEHHEFGILGAAMIAVSGGLNVLYLGTDLPAEEILRTIQQTSAKAVVLGWKAAGEVEQSWNEIQKVSKEMPKRVELWVGGIDSERIQTQLKKTRAVLLTDFQELEEHLSRLGWRR